MTESDYQCLPSIREKNIIKTTQLKMIIILGWLVEQLVRDEASKKGTYKIGGFHNEKEHYRTYCCTTCS